MIHAPLTDTAQPMIESTATRSLRTTTPRSSATAGVNECRCWHSSLQDLTVSARYRFGNDPWAITPVVRYILPSHGYRYQGEAVVGRNLQDS